MGNRLAFGRVFGEGPEAPEEAHLYVGEWVHVGVAEAYGALQDRGVVQEVLLFGNEEQGSRG